MRKVLLVVGLWLLWPAATAQAFVCARGCNARLTAESHLKRWRSPERFDSNKYVKIRLYANGHRVPAFVQQGGCAINYWGQGIVARVTGCAQDAEPLRLRYTSLRGPQPFTIRYRAELLRHN